MIVLHKSQECIPRYWELRLKFKLQTADIRKDVPLGRSRKPMSSILIIDDEATLREALSLTLKEVGYSVLEARNGREGLELLRNEPADLVLLDVFMPEKDGLETLREIRRLQPTPRVIVMSGGGSNHSLDILQVASFLGARRTLAKPFELQELMSVVRAELSQV